MIQKTCKQCNTTYTGDEVKAFFRINPDDRLRASAVARRAICIGCELSGRTTKKQRNRQLEKARRALQSHADKYTRIGIVKDRTEFAEKFRWNIHQMAHDIEHAFANGCAYCRQQFSEMAHGLADVTLDIINPEDLPYYGVNTRWCCATCNREKSKTQPSLWGAKLTAWDKWREQQDKLRVNIYAGLPLLENLK